MIDRIVWPGYKARVKRGEITYAKAGVNIEAGDAFAAGIGALAKRTHRPEVLSGIGGFAGLFRPNLTGMSEPVLVSGTDGVGTKLLIAQMMGRHNTIGIDLVAMCVNDVLTTGAEPLFFLDYFATGRLEPEVAQEVVRGIATGCELAGCALLGGETAEMPGMYPEGKYDLAGFSVGLVDRPKILDGAAVRAGDALIGVASSGLHSNGYSLVRHVLFELNQLALDSSPGPLTGTLGDALLEPTRIYASAVKAALAAAEVHAISHITGGGLEGNVARIVPEGLVARFDENAWTEPPIFGLMRELGVADAEMNKTFNRGLGLVFIAPAAHADALCTALRDAGETCWLVGEVTPV